MAKAYMQLTLCERRTIQESLDRGHCLKRIAKALGRSPSTISREVRLNRTPRPPKGRLGRCAERSICVRSGICGDICARPGESCSHCKLADCRMRCAAFRRSGRRCGRLDRFPHVCNGCRYSSGCTVRDRHRYVAAEADTAAKARRSESRRGINMSAARAEVALAQVKDAIGRGMGPYEISVAYAAPIGVSASTIYRWIEAGYAGMCNMDLERKVGFRPRKGGSRPRPTRHSARRSYASFCALDEDVRAAACEMDTVMGARGDAGSILTLYLRPCRLQLFLLLAEHTQAEVLRALSQVKSVASEGLFDELFSAVLTDNGAEFADESALGGIFGEKGGGTRLFYCDVRASNQKGGCEKAHTELRQVLPKGASVDHLTERHMALAMSHVNSNPRRSLCGLSPIDVFLAAYGQAGRDLLDALGVEKVSADELLLRPSLLEPGGEDRR